MSDMREGIAFVKRQNVRIPDFGDVAEAQGIGIADRAEGGKEFLEGPIIPRGFFLDEHVDLLHAMWIAADQGEIHVKTLGRLDPNRA